MGNEQLSDEEYRAYTEEYSHIQTQLRDSFRRGKIDERLVERAKEIMARIRAHLDAPRADLK